MTDVERQKSTEEGAAGLSADIRSVYGQMKGGGGAGGGSSPYAPKKGDWNTVVMTKMINQMMGIKK